MRIGMLKHVRAFLAAVVAGAVWAAPEPGPWPDPDGEPADMKKPVKVFVIMGQSNALGFGRVSGDKNGTLEHAVKAKSLYPYLVDDAGDWTVRKDVRNVRVMCSGNSPAKTYVNDWLTPRGQKNIGLEIGTGHAVGEVLDAPVMMLKSCIGNRSLGWDLLPPGSEPYEFNGKMLPGYRGTPDDPEGDGEPVEGKWYAGCQYDGDVAAAKKVLEELDRYYPGAEGYEVTGFFWWQGDKDFRNKAHAANYEKNLVQLIKALRKDFDAPDAKFVIATLGQTKKGAGGTHGQIIDAMFAVDGDSGEYPEFEGSVKTFYTHPVSKGGSSSGHYSHNAETYMNVGEGMGRAMAELLQADGVESRRQPTAGRQTTPRRAARTVSPENRAALDRSLLRTLVALSEEGQLTPTTVPLSITRASVQLAAADADGTLTFKAASGQTAPIEMADLKLVDLANLAILVAGQRPASGDAKAMAAVYLECVGNVSKADAYFEKAGAASRAKLEKLLD